MLNPLEVILNDKNVIVISCNSSGEITYISPGIKNVLGYEPEDLLGNNWWKKTFTSKAEGIKVKKRVCKIFNNNGVERREPYERLLLCNDGSLKWIEWRDAKCDGENLVSFGVDITSWKEKEALKIQADSILNNIDLMLLVSNANGDIIYGSPSIKDMIGYEVEEIMGNKWWQVTYEDQDEAERIKSSIYKYVYYKKESKIDINKRKIRTKGGNYIWVEWQVSKGSNGTYISIGTDISERIKNEKMLENAIEVAEKSLEVKSEFLANMSHEIRTPMNSIIGFTNLLLETEITKKQKEYLLSMNESGNILLSLINNILDLSKLDTMNLKLEMFEFNLHDKIVEIIKMMKLQAENKNLQLDLNIAPETPIYVISDPTRIGQILINLVGNAVKFTDKGSVNVLVKPLKIKDNLADIYFEVSDSGIGIIETKINTVFDAFSQSSKSTSRIYGGTGLGLTIVKKLVNLLDGSIEVKSKFGVGSTFYLTLPLKLGVGKIDSADINEEFSKKIPLGMNILVVEDNKINQLVAKHTLENWNCVVDIANNGIQGVKQAQKKLYDIILMDVQMPIMDGYEATGILKNDLTEEISKIPIIAMTAFATKSELQKAMDNGMDDFISKPFKPEDLYRTLSKFKKRQTTFEPETKESKKVPMHVEEDKGYVNLANLRKETYNEPSILVLLVEMFVKDLKEYFQTIDSELPIKNWKVLYEYTHKIKPTISLFGISEMEPLILELERRFKNETDLDNVGSLIAELQKINIHVNNELNEFLNTIKNE